jgi:hypothetical protein
MAGYSTGCKKGQSMNKTTSSDREIGQTASAKKRTADPLQRAGSASPQATAKNNWATETFKRIAALRKALNGKQLP